MKALIRKPSPRLPEGIVTHIDRTPIDVELALHQHEAYKAALRACGWETVEVEPAPDCPDSVFIEDALIVRDRLALVTRPAAPSRQAETAGAEAAARALGLDVARIEAPGALDGGDVLQAGDTVYVGRGGRTNAEGIRQLRAQLGAKVVPVALQGVLHLKSAVTALPDGTFLISRGVPAELFPAVRRMPEESGCHVVPLDAEKVLIAKSAPRSAELINDLGFTPVVVDISEFEKLEGCVTCLSVLIPKCRTDASL